MLQRRLIHITERYAGARLTSAEPPMKIWREPQVFLSESSVTFRLQQETWRARGIARGAIFVVVLCSVQVSLVESASLLFTGSLHKPQTSSSFTHCSLPDRCGRYFDGPAKDVHFQLSPSSPESAC